MIAVLLTLILSTGRATPPDPHGDDIPCGFLMGTPNSIADERAAAGELKAWATAPATIDYLQIFHDVRDFLVQAPREVRDVLGLAGALTKANPGLDQATAKSIADHYMIPELEVFFDVETAELAATMRTIEALGAYVSPEAREYLAKVTAHPSRHYVLALLLHSLHAELKNRRIDFSSERQRSGLGWLRVLREPVTSSRALTLEFVRSFYRLTRTERFPLIDNSHNDNVSERAPKFATTTEEERMIAWAAEKLHAHDIRSEPARPASWLILYKEAAAFLKTPVSANPKMQTVGGVRITQSLLTPTAESVASILDDFDQKMIADFHAFHADLLPYAPVGEDRALWNQDRLEFAFTQDQLNSPWGVSVYAAMVNLTETVISGKDLPILAINQLRRLVMRRLKEYFPLPRELNDARDAKTSAWGPYLESPLAEELFEPTEPADTPANEDLSLFFFKDGVISLSQIKAGVPYAVEFRRPNVNFGGRQTFVFEDKALSDMMKRMSKSIPPMEWLEAICEGLARDYGQAGVKILGSEGERGLRFEIKILSSPYRIYGHLRDRRWILEYIADEH